MGTPRNIDTCGRVISVTYSGSGDMPFVRVSLQLADASLLALLFQSRSTLDAVEIGQLISVRGAVVLVDGMPTIYNPHYTIEEVL